MNAFSFVVLFALVGEFVVDVIANLLNLKSLRSDPPRELQGLSDPAEYARSQAYTTATTRLHLISSAIGLLVVLAFWFASGFNALDQMIRSLGFGSTANGLLYVGALGLGYMLISLPFAIYDTFVIEERFGFNRTTVGTFVADRLKGLALAVVIGGPLLAAVLFVFETVGPLAWLYAWVLVTVFSFAMQFLAPTLIMPLFMKFQPVEDETMKEAILRYAQSVDFPLDKLFVVDASKRSTKSNAFFTGFGRTKRAALFDTLINKLGLDELVGVVAHEIGHYKKRHVIQGTLLGIGQTGVMLFLLGFFLQSPGLYEAFYMDEQSVYAGFVFFGLLFTPVELPLSILMHAISRKHEYEADRFAHDTLGESRPLIEALKKLSADNLTNLTPHPFYVFLTYSHPTLLQRVQALRSYTPHEQRSLASPATLSERD
jgi:STE24 endopeptidase